MPKPKERHFGRKAMLALGALALPVVVAFGVQNPDRVESVASGVMSMLNSSDAVPTSFTTE